MGNSKILAFDLYGTLLEEASITTALRDHLPGSTENTIEKIAKEWLRYQFEYTLRLNSMGLYENYYDLTKKSLRHTLMANSINIPPASMNLVVDAFSTLLPFPDVAPTFSTLASATTAAAAATIETLIFSNGSSEMLAAAISNSKPLAGTRYVSVEDTQRYKPDPETYKYLLGKLGRWGDPKSVVLISANAFDIVGARNAGLETVWVDRTGGGWRDGLGEPQHVVRSLEEVLEVVGSGGGGK